MIANHIANENASECVVTFFCYVKAGRERFAQVLLWPRISIEMAMSGTLKET
jgi:hypothetical protein